jgi:hypothetical protein
MKRFAITRHMQGIESEERNKVIEEMEKIEKSLEDTYAYPLSQFKSTEQSPSQITVSQFIPFMNKGTEAKLTADLYFTKISSGQEKSYSVWIQGVVSIVDGQQGADEFNKLCDIIHPDTVNDYTRLDGKTPIPAVKLPYVPKNAT